LAEYGAIKQDFWESEVGGDIERIEVMKAEDNRARKCGPVDQRRVGNMHEICGKLAGNRGKLIQIPEISAKGPGPKPDSMNVQPAVETRYSLAHVAVLPGRDKQMKRGDLISREKTSRDVGGMTGDP
jgi:hypothetical protein